MGSFVCILPPKGLELQNGLLQRAFHELELHQALHQIDFRGTTREFMFLPGGGLVVQQGTSSAESGTCMCAFNGRLDNYAYLVKKYCLSEPGQPSADDPHSAALQALQDSVSLSDINSRHPVSEAEVLCVLYARLGTTLLPKLRGEFAFVIFDSKTVRVLAARDPHGSFQLAQARASDGSLVIASGQYLPEGCRDLTEILPGYFKYGWLSRPQKYAHSEEETRMGAQSAAAAAQRALQGATATLRPPPFGSHSLLHGMASPPPAPASDAGSGDSLSSSKGRTRRGKRAGRHQRQRQSLDESRRSMDLQPAAAALATPSEADPAAAAAAAVRPSRLSLDSQAAPRRSIADRADWWRPSGGDEGGRRHSVDISGVRRQPGTLLSPLAPVFEPASPVASPAAQPADTHEDNPGASGDHSATARGGPAPGSPAGGSAAVSMATGSEAEAGRSSISSAGPSSGGTSMDMPVHSLEARSAMADVVGSIVAGMGIPRSRSQAALGSGDLASALADGNGKSSPVSLGPAASPMAPAAAAAAAAQQLGLAPPGRATKLEALDVLPAGLIQKLQGPYREEAASVRMLANLLFHSPCALCITDATQEDMPIVYVNHVFEKATGYAAPEVVGRNCRFLQAAPGKQRSPSAAAQAIRRALDGGRAKGVRLLNYKQDGTPVFNDLSVVPLRNAEGVITHHVGMQTFSLVKDGERGPGAGGAPAVCGAGVQTMGGLTGLLAKSRSCMELASVDDDEPVDLGV